MKIELSKTPEKHGIAYPVPAWHNGMILTVSIDGRGVNLQDASRILTGTSMEDYCGVFTVEPEKECSFRNKNHESVLVDIVPCHCGQSFEEIEAALRQNVAAVKSAFEKLPKPYTFEI